MQATAATAAVAAPPRRGHEVVDGTGRRLSYLVYGQQDLQKAKAVLLFLHGVPASACEAATLDRAAAEAGMAVVSVDRPGVGESSPHTVHSLASFAVDLGSLLDALGLQGVALAGESGGGPYAAAAAALLGPTKVSQLHLVSAVGPLDGVLLDTLPKGMDRTTINLLRWRMRALAWPLHRLVKYMADVSSCAPVVGACPPLINKHPYPPPARLLVPPLGPGSLPSTLLERQPSPPSTLRAGAAQARGGHQGGWQ